MRSLLFSMVLAVIIGWTQLCAASLLASIGFSQNGGVNIYNPYTLSVTKDTSFSVDVYFTILSPPSGVQVVSAYDLDILYSSNLSTPTVTFGTSLGIYSTDLDTTEVLQVSKLGVSGVATIKAVSLLSDPELQQNFQMGPVPKNIQLATLAFTPTQTGSATLSFDWSNTRGMRDVKGLGNQRYTIIPEPSTYLLSVIAGAAVAAAARLRKRKVESA